MIKFISSLLLACCLSVNAAAVELTGFFSATVAIPDRSKVSFEQGLRDALVQVLAKASAEEAEKIKMSSRLALDLSHGHQMASQYAFETKKVLNKNTGKEQDQLYLKASFPEKVVTDLLQTANLPFWPNNRPQILIWPVIKRGGSAAVATVSTSEDAQLLKMIGDKAEQYGLPWVLGEMAGQSNVNRLWQWKDDTITAASKKYQKEVILVSRLGITSDNRGLGGWLLIDHGKLTRVDVNADTLEEFVEAGMAMAASQLASRYAVRLSSQNNELLLQVDGIDSDEKYQALINYLESLDVVGRVYLLNVEGQSLRLAVTLKSDLEQMQKVLLQHNKLVANPKAETNAYEMALLWNE